MKQEKVDIHSLSSTEKKAWEGRSQKQITRVRMTKTLLLDHLKIRLPGLVLGWSIGVTHPESEGVLKVTIKKGYKVFGEEFMGVFDLEKKTDLEIRNELTTFFFKARKHWKSLK